LRENISQKNGLRLNGQGKQLLATIIAEAITRVLKELNGNLICIKALNVKKF